MFLLTKSLDLGDKSPTYKIGFPILIDTLGDFDNPKLVENPILKDF